MLAGHSRLAAFKQLAKEGYKQFKDIPTVEYQADNLEEAQRFAREESNVLATLESDIDRANIYRKDRLAGKSKAEIKRKAKELEKRTGPLFTI